MTGRAATILFVVFAPATAIGPSPLAAPKDASPLATPLETSAFAKLPTSEEINGFLARLAASDGRAKLIEIGRSAGGRKLIAFAISSRRRRSTAGDLEAAKLTVLIVAGQHGREPSGTEAALMVARDLMQGPLQGHLNGSCHGNLLMGAPLLRRRAWLCGDGFCPLFGGLGPEGTKSASRYEMALEVECIVGGDGSG